MKLFSGLNWMSRVTSRGLLDLARGARQHVDASKSARKNRESEARSVAARSGAGCGGRAETSAFSSHFRAVEQYFMVFSCVFYGFYVFSIYL